MKCSKCGAELSEDTKFCSYCGQKVEVQDSSKTQESNPVTSSVGNYTYGQASSDNKKEAKHIDGSLTTSAADKIKEKGISFWSKRSLFGKIATIAFVAFALLAGVAFLSGKTVAAVIAVLQIIITVVAVLMQKGVIKTDPKQEKLKYVLLVIAVLLTIPNVMSFSMGTDSGDINDPDTEIENSIPVQKDDANDSTEEVERPIQTITKDTQYAYMSDEWNVYIAIAVSDSIVKVEHWDKTLSSDKTMEYSSDVATYKINDPSSGFEWIDDEHTAFYLTVQDKGNSRLRKPKSVAFTINTSDSDVNKGTNCDDKIIHYVYTNDDWHAYKAIPLTEKLIKIEAWCRSSSLEKLLYGYDVCLIDLENNETDFEWGGDDHKAFTITMQDSENDHYWEEESLVVFTAEEGEYEYSTVYEYLDGKIVHEGEAAVPQSASDYKFGNYKDAEADLRAAGFTEISYEILYDIVLGWTQEEEVDGISIDGNTDFEKGDVFNKNAPVVITYHMKEEDDPNKTTETTPPEETESPIEDNSQTNPVKTNITVDSNDDFAALMKITDQTDSATISKFANAYSGRVIEFDGCIVLMMHHGDYKTRFDVAMANGNYGADRLYGPLFAFEDVNFSDMNVSGTDTVMEGMNFRITAKIEGYSDAGGYILLQPVSLKAR